MSDELKDSDQDESPSNNNSNIDAEPVPETDTELNLEPGPIESIENDGILDQNSDESSDESLSAMDDPEILASLKQLTISQNSESNKTAVTAVIHTPEQLKNIVEASILAANKAISLDKILTLFPEEERVDKDRLREVIVQLMEEYQSRGVELVEVSSGFRFQVAQSSAPWVSRLWEEKPQKYSRALLETLALVAYRQPITRGEIEEIRGVSVSSQIMRTLVEREWVRVIGHRDVPGKPAMYATTRQFLDYFSLKKLDELPSLAEIRDLDTINAELDFGDSPQNNDISVSIEQDNDSQDEENLMDSSDTQERVDIDVELKALSETYKQIDSIEQRYSVDDMETTDEAVDDMETTDEAVDEMSVEDKTTVPDNEMSPLEESDTEVIDTGKSDTENLDDEKQ